MLIEMIVRALYAGLLCVVVYLFALRLIDWLGKKEENQNE